MDPGAEARRFDRRIMKMLRKHRWPLWALGAIILIAAGTLPATGGQAPDRRILNEALANEGDRAVLERCLAQIDQEVAARPHLADNHYARGRILSLLGRLEDALAAYNKAVELNPKESAALPAYQELKPVIIRVIQEALIKKPD
jgi:cytochrome c-type biogenesis protein CcmH/NrfG